jgi:hypothetical protein
MRLVIVGNASQPSMSPAGNTLPAGELARFIDDSDLVVRFNSARNQDEAWTGSRTDILYIRGNGKPAFWFSESPITFDHVERPKQVVSVVDMGEYKRRRPDKRGHIDYTDKLAALNSFERVSRLDNATLDAMRGALRRAGSRLMPSLGLAAFVHLLSNPELSDHEKFVVGFTFSGWEGHDWEQEKRLAEAWFASGALTPLA